MRRALPLNLRANAPKIWLAAIVTLQMISLVASTHAQAQTAPPTPDRRALLTWDGPRQRIYGNFDFQDVVDAEVS
jgi:hypothetical protein